MERQIDIYEKLQEQDRKISELYQIIEGLKKVEQENAEVGWYSIDEICSKFSFCRKKFHDYKKLIPLQKATKLGKFDRYRKKDVHVWLEKVKALKRKTPALFRPDAFD